MSSAASTALAAGFNALLAHHGEREPLEYIESSKVIRRENGEAVTDENGIPQLVDEDSEQIAGIFDESYEMVSPGGIGITTTAIAATVLAVSVEGIEPGAIILREGIFYFVQIVQEPGIDGSQVLILSRQIH